MKVLNYIHLRNMFVHKDKRIDFKSGKNYIVGSIGTGKTLITESIAFAFFGTVALRGKAPSYKDVEVELSFNYNEETFVIVRKVNDAILYMLDKGSEQLLKIANSTSVVNQKIISLLGYNYDIYLLSNYCKQKKLAYFSELTPAKRLQYIDKVSGIEESEELLSWLTSNRKVLKSNINILKSLVVKPTLPDSLDLKFDYNSSVKEISEKLNSLTSLYTELNYFKDKLVIVTKPSINENDPAIIYANYSEEEFTQYSTILDELDSLNKSIEVIETKLRDIPKLPSKLNNYSIETINSLLEAHSLKLLESIPDDFNIECPCCKLDVNLKSVLPKASSVDTSVSIKDLYLAQDFLLNHKTLKRELELSLRHLEKEFEVKSNLIPNDGIKILNSAMLLKHREVGLDKLKEYELKVIEYDEIIASNTLIQQQIDSIQDKLDSYFKEQADLLYIKDDHLKKSTEKEIYLERLDNYKQALSKFTAYSDELDLLNRLIKGIPVIVSSIKADTIPAINSSSSYYLNLITSGVMTKIEITEDYSLIVDGVDISLKSGGQQDLASLAFRLSLGQSIIKGMLPLFVGDEIDSSGTADVSSDISSALSTISQNGYQVILITHSDTSNIENDNIIQL